MSLVLHNLPRFQIYNGYRNCRFFSILNGSTAAPVWILHCHNFEPRPFDVPLPINAVPIAPGKTKIRRNIG